MGKIQWKIQNVNQCANFDCVCARGVVCSNVNGGIHKRKKRTGKKADLVEYIKTNIKFQTEYLAMLNRYISNDDNNYGTLLDERTSAEIDSQQKSVDTGVVEY